MTKARSSYALFRGFTGLESTYTIGDGENGLDENVNEIVAYADYK